MRPTLQLLNLGLLRDLQRVIYLDPKVSNRALQLGMTEQDLDGCTPQIFTPHRLRRSSKSIKRQGAPTNTRGAILQARISSTQ